MANTAWMIDPLTKDLAFDKHGILATVEDNETSAQCVRLTLEAWKGDFTLVPDHGTDYEKILGEREDEELADEVIREAVFQEDKVSALEELAVSVMENRKLEVIFSGRLNDGSLINMEVKADG